MSDRPRWQSTRQEDGARRRRAGRPSCAITPTASHRWTSSSSRQSRFGCCTAPASADSASAPGARSGPVHEQRSPVLPPIISVVSVDREGNDDHPARDTGAMASRGVPPLLALEIPEPGRPRPPIDANLRALIRWMSIENMLWGAPRIHDELLKLGFAVARSTVAKYMASQDGHLPGQRWGTFLRNHLPQIAAMDLFVVPTIGFNLLYVLVLVRLARRELVWINVTAHPTAEWIARQITEAFPWDEVPRYLIRDRDRIYGVTVTRRLRAMGIQSHG